MPRIADAPPQPFAFGCCGSHANVAQNQSNAAAISDPLGRVARPQGAQAPFGSAPGPAFPLAAGAAAGAADAQAGGTVGGQNDSPSGGPRSGMAVAGSGNQMCFDTPMTASNQGGPAVTGAKTLGVCCRCGDCAPNVATARRLGRPGTLAPSP